jgi:uncharacterized membrane protein
MMQAVFKPINWLWFLGALVAGGIIHILAVFAAADLATPLTTPLENAATVNSMTVLPAVSAATQIMPFQSGDLRYAVCPFDLSGGPLILKASFGEGPWTVVVFDRSGAMLYSTTNTELQRRDATLILARTSETRAASLPISRQAAATNITVNLPQARGVAWIQAPVLGVGYEAETERLLEQASCEPVGGFIAGDAPAPTPP